MWRQIGGTVGAVLLCTALAQAEVIDVTTSVDAPDVGGKYQVNLGETHTLSVFGQLKVASSGNGIFGWDVDLRVGDTAILGLLAGTVDRTGWDNEAPPISSPGTPMPWGIDAIYDTSFLDETKGLSEPALLFSVDFTSLSIGESSLTIEPDATSGADFVAHLVGEGGDYSAAFAIINVVVAEPASISLLATGALVLLMIRRRRSM